MAPSLLGVVRMVCWFWGFFPLCYYVALTVVCGLHRKWISFSFALATAVVLVVWLVLNGVAIVAAWVLDHRRRVAATKSTSDFLIEDVAGTFVPQAPTTGVVTAPSSHQHTPKVLAAGDAPSLPTSPHHHDDVRQMRNDDADNDGPRAFEDSDDEVDLSSIQESMATTTQTNLENASFASAPFDTTTANPLAARGAQGSAMRSRRGLVVRAQPPPPAGSAAERRLSSVEDTCLLTPPDNARPLATTLSTALPAVTGTPRHSKTTQEKHIGSDSNSTGSDPHEAAVTKPGSGAQARHPAHGSTTAHAAAQVVGHSRPTTTTSRKTAAAAVTTASSPPSSSTALRAAFMMPIVSIYVTIALTLLLLVAAILFEYETHCLMLAFPALSVPCLWSTLIPLRKFFDTYPRAARNFHVRVLHFLTHWISLTVIALVGMAVYVVAFALEAATWTPYVLKAEAAPKSIRVVSYLSPLPSFIIVIFFVVNNTLHSRRAAAQASQRRMRSARRGSAEAAVSPRAHNSGAAATQKTQRGAESKFGPLGGFAGTSDDRQRLNSPNSAQPPEVGLPVLAPRHSTATQPDFADDSASTLSSIVRSSMGSSIFIPPSSLASPSKMSISKNHVRGSRTSSNGSAGLHALPSAAHINTLPQLKTVTMLYIAYRNIYDEGDETADMSFARGAQQGGMAANRNLQQSVASNYEALMEAIEDAREQGSADANAYVLTAYEDALCLVWGLVPFSSEPVHLAIEKARQIMEAFRSRPKPPPTSTNEQQELVAAVVVTPHSLVGFIGAGGFRSVHFFNPRQHDGGAQLLRRGLAMYRRLPSVQTAMDGAENTFSGILMNGRARNNTAGNILARPCGIKSLPPSTSGGGAAAAAGNGGVMRGGMRRPPLGMAAAAAVEQYPIMYEFLDHVQAKEEEWHLVVQRQERLGAKFGFLTEATQLLQQGDPKGAREVLTRAVENTNSGNDADNVTLAQMMLEDLNRIASKPNE